MTKRVFRTLLLMLFGLPCCAAIHFLSIQGFSESDSVHEPNHSLNTLTPEEESAGWSLLFDGKTTRGWRGFRKPDFPSDCWTVSGGALQRIRAAGGKREECGDIVTVEQYDNFEFQLEWKMEPGGNSGVKYLVLEERPASWEQAYFDYHLKSLKKSGRNEPPEKLKPERWKYMAMGFELQLIDDEKNADARVHRNRLTVDSTTS